MISAPISEHVLGAGFPHPFEHLFGCDVAGMEVTMFSVLAPPARRCLLQLVVVVSGVRVPVGEGSDGGIAHAWSWSC